jgi:SAM-dependent methyltransferase
MYRIGSVSFDLVRCACGMVYCNPRPDGPSLAAMYDDPSYYREGYTLGVETQGYFERKDELIARYERELAALQRQTGSTGSLFELGAAGGFLLEAARRRGFAVAGVELSPSAVEYARAQFGLDVFHGDLFAAPYADRSFDIAVADNVLEHTSSPERVLRKLLLLLRPGGHLVVIVPSYVNSIYFRTLARLKAYLPRALLGQRLLKLLKMSDEERGHPYHILEFDRPRLLDLLQRSGFSVVSVEGSVPLPAHLFKAGRNGMRERLLRSIFRSMDALMHRNLIPAASLRVLARRPAAEEGQR